jgi:hypothetical protein
MTDRRRQLSSPETKTAAPSLARCRRFSGLAYGLFINPMAMMPVAMMMVVVVMVAGNFDHDLRLGRGRRNTDQHAKGGNRHKNAAHLNLSFIKSAKQKIVTFP